MSNPQRNVTPVAHSCILLFLLIGGAFSCRLFTEPDPEPYDLATPPLIKPYAHLNFDAGDTLSGGIFVTFRPDEPPSSVSEIRFLIDDTLMSESTTKQFEYFVETRSFVDGVHVLTFCVYSSGHDVGLLKLLDSPTEIYSTTLRFQHRPIPPSPRNVYSSVQSGHTTITWDYSSTEEAQATCFVIERLDPRYTDTVSSQTRKYVDQLPNYHYRIGAGNVFGVNYVFSSPR